MTQRTFNYDAMLLYLLWTTLQLYSEMDDFSALLADSGTVLVYVDDVIVTGNDIDSINRLKSYLDAKFHIKDLGRLKYFLCIKTPHKPHLDATQRVHCYLKATPGHGILLPSASASPISWRTKKQTTVARSSAEVEYRSMAISSCKLTWLKFMLTDLGVSHFRPMHLHCDNQAALRIVVNLVFHERTKHIELDCHLI
ncbi:uncharacterized protein LOC110008145 [Amborella trichopoda]|uniref:uncharacterized protein LOC110008145 n=1 Tax=Amborella trichopoda TaxID=13333 RepID=UPI0009C00FBC|nr:uncharacterized protein LOC110008145 [Amborella trichopoda]|eukprot:XP_020529457.1 uncharacterized protein LOC110008145 [Amborella trichopoda]